MHKPSDKACAKEININPHNYCGEDPCNLDNLKVKIETNVSIICNKNIYYIKKSNISVKMFVNRVRVHLCNLQAGNNSQFVNASKKLSCFSLNINVKLSTC